MPARRPQSSARTGYYSAHRTTDFRKSPHLYRVARGEQGVLTAEPYKSELLPLWRFATPAAARKSASALLKKFRAYLKAGDLPGADMTRKFLQMGYTRSRRYANHTSGRKYSPTGSSLPGAKNPDPTKSASAAIFKQAWTTARTNPTYLRLKKLHQSQYG